MLAYHKLPDVQRTHTVCLFSPGGAELSAAITGSFRISGCCWTKHEEVEVEEEEGEGEEGAISTQKLG